MSRRKDTPADEDAEDLRGFDDFDLLLGDIMRGERATMGKSLLDVQRELKIKANYIAAIENTDPSAFETPGFIAGYVRSYARYLGLDPEWAFKTFCNEGNFTVAHGMSADASVRRSSRPKKSATASELASKPAHLRDPFTEPSVSYLPRGEAALSGVEPRAIGSIIVLLALVVGIGYGGWAVLQEVQKVRFTPVDQTPDVLAELDPMSAAIPQEADGVEDVASVAPTTQSFDRLYRPEALDVPVMISRDGPIASINPDTIGALAPSKTERVLSADMPRPDNLPFSVPGSVPKTISGPDDVVAEMMSRPKAIQVVEDTAPSVTLFAVRPSWVRVTSADGTVVFEKILDAGEEFAVPLTENPPTLRAGNAGSLYFNVNGNTYGPAGDGPAVIKNVALSPEDLKDSYSIADLSNDSDLARFVSVAEANEN